MLFTLKINYLTTFFWTTTARKFLCIYKQWSFLLFVKRTCSFIWFINWPNYINFFVSFHYNYHSAYVLAFLRKVVLLVLFSTHHYLVFSLMIVYYLIISIFGFFHFYCYSRLVVVFLRRDDDPFCLFLWNELYLVFHFYWLF